jgi:hypothetical protein
MRSKGRHPASSLTGPISASLRVPSGSFSDRQAGSEHHLVEPEILVGLGEETVFGSSNQEVLRLHMHIEDWLGDDLLTCHPVFLVTEELRSKLLTSSFTGFSFETINQSFDESFRDNFQLGKPIPTFFWLKVNGQDGAADFFVDEDANLMVSDKALKFLEKYANLGNCDIDVEDDPDMDDLFDDL